VVVVLGGAVVLVVVVEVLGGAVVLVVVVDGVVLLQTLSVTGVPVESDEPAVGFWLITLPFVVDLQVDVVTALTRLNPLPASVDLAAVTFWPTTPGTTAWQGPDEIVRFTTVPGTSATPAAGFWADTRPLEYELEQAAFVDPTLSPVPDSVAPAVA
jgi:hypothetical protein